MIVVEFGVNVPLPEVVHVPPVAPPPTVPPKVAEAVPEHSVWAAPTLTVAALRTVSITCAVTVPQGDVWPLELSVKVTVPVEASAVDAV